MSIIITNISEQPTETGLNKYEVKINNRHIAYFTHRREAGLSKCLNHAAFAVAEKQLDNCPVCHGEGRLRQDLERPNVKISVPCKMCGEKEATIEIPGWSEQVLFCESCAKEWNDDQKRIDELQKQGHSHHCACRQVWGDGECECALYAKGYDPYAWMKGEYEREIPIRHKGEK